MSSNVFYNALRRIASPFAFACFGQEHILNAGPAIFVSNHLGSAGPIQVILATPVRFYPWIIADMMDRRRGPRYLFDDFIHPDWHLSGRFGMTVSAFISRAAIAMFHRLGAIPVEQNGLPLEAFRRSLQLLAQGKNVLVFPEDPDTPADPETQVRTFRGGFVQLCYMFQRMDGTRLPVYPMAVSSERCAVQIGAPMFLAESAASAAGIEQSCAEVREVVRSLYRSLRDGSTA